MRKLLLLGAVVALFSCKSKEESALEEIANQIEIELSPTIQNFTNSMEFLYYATPNNYWYSKRYTNYDAIDDKFKKGIKKLTRLQKELKSFSSTIESVNKSKESLLTNLIKDKKEYMELNEGFNDLIVWHNAKKLVRGMSQFQSADERRAKLPKSLEVHLADFSRATDQIPTDIINKISAIESKIAKEQSLSKEQKLFVRKGVRSLLTKKVNGLYFSEDKKPKKYYLNILINKELNGKHPISKM